MNLRMKTCLFVAAAGLLAFAAFQLKDFHIGIGERAMGGYDGSSDPGAAADAAREAREAAARAEAAVDALKHED